MKKRIALLVLMILAISTLLVACGNTAVTDKKTRWTSGESLTFDISLADFSTKESTNAENHYYKDVLYAGELDPTLNDRIVPTAVSGTYVVTLTLSDDLSECTVDTVQTLFSTYPKDTVTLDVEGEHKAKVTKDDTDNTITIQSVTNTSVTFKNSPAQTPIRSSTTVNGFYIGKEMQEWSSYTVETTYSTYKKGMIAKVKLNGGQEEDYKIKGSAIIDGNQILTYVRSFEKTSTSFQDQPTVIAYDPLTNTQATMNFVYTHQQNAWIEHNGQKVCTKLNRVDVLLNGNHFVQQLNVPDLKKKGLDLVAIGDTPFANHTQLRFRSGFLSYELKDFLTDAIVDELDVEKPKQEPAQ